MQGFRIRRGATERSVPDAPALLALAASGEIRPTDEVRTADGWIAASALPILRGRLGGDDPWAAWSDVDSVDAASLYKRMVDDPEELPVEAVTPVGEALPRVAAAGAAPRGVLPAAPEPVALEPDALEPLPEPGEEPDTNPGRRAGGIVRPPVGPPGAREPLPLAAAPRPAHRAPPPGELGEVIDFPRPRPPMPDPFVRPPRPRAGPPPLVRTSRVAAMVVAGLLAVLLGYAWIRVNAFSRAGVGAAGPARATSAATPAPEPPSPLVLLDAELRKSLSATPRAVREAGDLSDALMIELVQQRLEVVEANGLVTKWVGKQGDEPRVAEVRVRYRSGGDMARELGAVALVVGRYKRFYRLDIPVFEVTELGTGGVTRIDPDKAEAYYQARISLEQLLASIAGK